MTVKGSMVTLFTFSTILLAACSHDPNTAAYGPGANGNGNGNGGVIVTPGPDDFVVFDANKDNFTCEQQQIMLSHNQEWSNEGTDKHPKWVLVDDLGDRFTPGRKELRDNGGIPYNRCTDDGSWGDDGYEGGS